MILVYLHILILPNSLFTLNVVGFLFFFSRFADKQKRCPRTAIWPVEQSCSLARSLFLSFPRYPVALLVRSVKYLFQSNFFNIFHSHN